jgi:uncharacterized protein (DUF1330 family)
LELSREFVAVLAAGVCVGVAVTQGIHAQQTKEPPAYIIAEVEKDASKPQDTEAARRYAEEAPKSLIPFGGRYVVRGGKVQTLEGEAPKGYIVVIGFDSVGKAREWYEVRRPVRPTRCQPAGQPPSLPALGAVSHSTAESVSPSSRLPFARRSMCWCT